MKIAISCDSTCDIPKDLIEKYGGQLIRWVMLSTHYRNPLNFTDDVLNNVSIDEY